MRSYLWIIFPLVLFGCQTPTQQTEPPPSLDGQTLVDAAILSHGAAAYDHTQVEFDFRGRHYVAHRDGGLYQYERIFSQDDQLIRDILTNDGFTREVDGVPVLLPDTTADKYANSVNSVLYFALLPYSLNDPAVNKQYVRDVKIKETVYHEVRVTFQQEGGGKDYQDEFRYYFHPETGHMEYLAYSYETDGGGIRFREAYNAREIGGIRFQDYINYKADPATITLDELPTAFQTGTLNELSRIESESISVNASAQ